MPTLIQKQLAGYRKYHLRSPPSMYHLSEYWSSSLSISMAFTTATSRALIDEDDADAMI